MAGPAGARRSDGWHPHEVAFDQLERVQGWEQPRSARETLQSAHGTDPRLHVAMIPLAAIGRDHQVVEAGGGVPGTGRAVTDSRRIERGFVRDNVFRSAPRRTDRATEER